jgi:hypothetical protein
LEQLPVVFRNLSVSAIPQAKKQKNAELNFLHLEIIINFMIFAFLDDFAIRCGLPKLVNHGNTLALGTLAFILIHLLVVRFSQQLEHYKKLQKKVSWAAHATSLVSLSDKRSLPYHVPAYVSTSFSTKP